jgi:TRAP-type C4-dicarboxylate transport system permease small subunit
MPLRRLLDGIYDTSGRVAAVCLAATFVVMLLQVAGRETGFLFRGADDIAAWLCAASAFFALGHTFRHGELVRMGLWIESLSAAWRWRAEVFALSITSVFVGYMLWAVVRFVYESWKFNELAQGLLKLPVWIPQLSFVLGVLVFFVAVLDELFTVLRREKPAYQVAEEARRAAGDFSETV